MPKVSDIIVRKPTEEEKQTCSQWPVWSCEPSEFDWEYTQQETCLIIEGKVTVTDPDGKESVSIEKGDYVVFPNDLSCKWIVEEAVRKYYDFD